MACLKVKPRLAGWKAQTNPLSYGGTPYETSLFKLNLTSNKAGWCLHPTSKFVAQNKKDRSNPYT